MTDEQEAADTLSQPSRLPVRVQIALGLVIVAVVGGIAGLVRFSSTRGAPPTSCTLAGCSSAVAVEVDRTGLPATFERSQPNGPRCDPTCFHVGLREGAAGLSQAPIPDVDPRPLSP